MADAASQPSLLSKEQFLLAHPWPSEYAQHKRLEWFWHFDVELSASELWRLVSDTSRMNRALKVSEMKFSERDGVLWGTSRPAGVFHEWMEVPWNWVSERQMDSVRIYTHGFSKVVYAVFRLQPIDEANTRLYAYFGSIPSGVFSIPLLKLGFASLHKDYQRLLPMLAEEVRNRRPFSLLEEQGPLSERAEERLISIAQELRKKSLDDVCIRKLTDWIRHGDEQDLFRIQVRERAQAFGVDEDALLRVCLHATRLGLLELSWDVMCPHCRGVSKQNGSLGSVSTEGHCDVCLIDFGTDVADAIEITFHVHPSIREVAHRTFCSAEPATKEHIRLQQRVLPQAAIQHTVSLRPGRYRMRLQGQKDYGFLDVSVHAESRSFDWTSSTLPQRISLGPDPVLTLSNDSQTAQTFIVETATWSDLALHPGRLLSLQEFRDLFSEEYLGQDVQLAIGEQTILFTDMVGSTALYAQQGDAIAFREVRRHFADVFSIIGSHRGAVVKTIGDAVMGAFTNPLDAVTAAKQIHDRFPPGKTDSVTRLRISLNTGPCIAVKLNTDIDYFGHTVNIAAKLQSLAGAWQVAMSERVYEAPGVKEWLAAQQADLSAQQYESPSLRAAVEVMRWTVYPHEASQQV